MKIKGEELYIAVTFLAQFIPDPKLPKDCQISSTESLKSSDLQYTTQPAVVCAVLYKLDRILFRDVRLRNGFSALIPFTTYLSFIEHLFQARLFPTYFFNLQNNPPSWHYEVSFIDIA